MPLLVSLRPAGSFLNLAATRHRPLQQAMGWRTGGGYTGISDGQSRGRPLPVSIAHQPLPQIRSVRRSAQRHQGGAQRAGDSRGAECRAGLIPREVMDPRLHGEDGAGLGTDKLWR